MTGTKFWLLSSRTSPGHRKAPEVAIRSEAILIYWNAGWTREAIAARIGVDEDTVAAHLRRARRNGDPRAEVRHAATRAALGQEPIRIEPRVPSRKCRGLTIYDNEVPVTMPAGAKG